MSEEQIPPQPTKRQAEALYNLRRKIEEALWHGDSAEHILELRQKLEQAEIFFSKEKTNE